MKRVSSIIIVLLMAAPASAAQQCRYRQPALSPDMVKVRALLKQDNPFASMFLLRSITQKEPKNVLAWHWRADAEQKAGETAAALDSITRAIDLNPCTEGAHEQRAVIEAQVGLNREAYDDLGFAISHDPRNASSHELRGNLLLNANEFIAALADFDAALALGPPNIDLLLNQGGVLQELGRFKQAIATYDRALEIEPGNVDAQVARGYSKFFLQDFAGAAADLQAGVDDNDNALAWHFLAQSRLGDVHALETFSQEAAQRPQDSWMRIVAEQFRGDKPEEDLLATVRDPEQSCDALFYLGEVSLAKKDTAHAKQLLLKAIDACPIDPKRYSGSLREYVGAAEELKRLQ